MAVAGRFSHYGLAACHVCSGARRRSALRARKQFWGPGMHGAGESGRAAALRGIQGLVLQFLQAAGCFESEHQQDDRRPGRSRRLAPCKQPTIL